MNYLYRRDDGGGFESGCRDLRYWVKAFKTGYSYFSKEGQKNRYIQSLKGEDTYTEGECVCMWKDNT